MTTHPALPAFTGTGSICIKCGARAATTTYRAENTHAGALIRAEHLERQCTRCGYRWPEATADTVPPAREGNEQTPASVRMSKNITHSNDMIPDSDKEVR